MAKWPNPHQTVAQPIQGFPRRGPAGLVRPCRQSVRMERSMSAFGTKRTCQSRPAMSAFGGKADMRRMSLNVSFDPKRTFGGPTVMSLLTLGGLRAVDFTIRTACEKTSPFDVQRAGPTHRDTWRKFDRRVPRETQGREASADFLQDHARLQPCERRAEAVVHAVSE